MVVLLPLLKAAVRTVFRRPGAYMVQGVLLVAASALAVAAFLTAAAPSFQGWLSIGFVQAPRGLLASGGLVAPLAFYLGAIVVNASAHGAGVVAAERLHRGAPVGPGLVVAGLAPRLPAVVATRVLVGVVAFSFFLPTILLWERAPALAVFLMLPTGIAVLLLIYRWYLADTVAVLDRRSVLGNLRESARLTRGDRIGLFGIDILLGVASTIVVFVTALLFIALLVPVAKGGPALAAAVAHVPELLVALMIAPVVATFATAVVRARREPATAALADVVVERRRPPKRMPLGAPGLGDASMFRPEAVVGSTREPPARIAPPATARAGDGVFVDDDPDGSLTFSLAASGVQVWVVPTDASADGLVAAFDRGAHRVVLPADGPLGRVEPDGLAVVLHDASPFPPGAAVLADGPDVAEHARQAGAHPVYVRHGDGWTLTRKGEPTDGPGASAAP